MNLPKPIFTFLLASLCYHFALSQCGPSDYPNDMGMYDVHLCFAGGAGEEAYTFKPSKTRVIHRQVDYHFPVELLEAVYINFDDGQGWQTIPAPNYIEEYYSISYSTDGEKTIKIKLDNSNNEHELFRIEIKEENVPYQSPDLIWEIETPETFTPPSGQYPSDSPYSMATVGKGNAYIKLAAGHQELTRPIIFVEGLDFGTSQKRDPNKNNEIIRYGENGWDVFSMGVGEGRVPAGGEELFKNIPAQFQDFEQSGYDLILLDFKDGADYIQKNAAVLQQLILEVNNNKQPDVNGVLHENVIVGASMGAIVSRYALAQMEAEGVGHCTNTYVSFDGPQQGANIPLSIQALIWFNGTFFSYDSNDADIEAGELLWNNLQRPAPRQLLNQNLLGTYQDGNLNLHCFIDDGVPNYHTFEEYEDLSINYNQMRLDLREELDDLGYPKRTWNIALTNGNPDGQNIGIEAGGEFLNADAWFGGVAGMAFKTKLWSLNGAPYADSDFGESWSSNQSLFYARRPLDFNLLGAPNVRVVAGVEVVGEIPSWDNAPGSVRNDIENYLVPSIQSVEKLEHAVNNAFPIATFVPTVSALDINTNDLFYDVEINLNKDNPDPNLSPFSKIYYPDELEPHVKTNEDNRQWIKQQINYTTPDLELNGVLPNVNGDTYNYGYARKTLPNLVINNGGSLSVNDQGSTAYLTEPPANRETFSVFTKDCGNGNIEVRNGGSILLGSTPDDLADKKGNLHVTDGNRLHVLSGGRLRAQRGSKLVIESGGILEIDAGANIELWWGESNIHIKKGGELRINGDFNFGGSGYFQFDEDHILSFGSNASAFRIHGESYVNRFIKLNNNARLQLSNIDLDLESGTVECSPGSGIDLDGGAVRTSAVRFDGADNLVLKLNAPESVDISFTRFYDAFTAIGLQNFNVDALAQDNIRFVDFYNCNQGVLVDNSNTLSVSNCNFYAQNLQQNGGSAINGENVNRIDLKYSSINDYQSPVDFGAVELRSVGMFNLISSTINNASTGILAACDSGSNNTTNVSLNSSTISNCETGIELEKGGIVEGGLDFGLVQMVCSKLINNGTGIRGTDILLNIDAYIQEPEIARPNSFILGISGHTYFDITYVDRIDTETIFATGNYWDRNPLSGFSTAANYVFRKSNSYTACQVGNFNGQSALLDVSERLDEEPANCLNSAPGPGELPNTEKELFSGDCGLMIKVKNEKELLGQQYVKAAWALKSEDHSTAMDRYGALAKIPNKRRNGADQSCRHYIDVARVMANMSSQFAIGYDNGGEDDLKILETAELRLLKIWPNPASSVVHVHFDRERFALFVYDMLGNEVFSKEVTDGEPLDVSNWESGIYLLKAIDPETGKQYSKKLIVN